MFESVLIASRGEIARRVVRTLRRLGIRAIAVHTDADRHAPHVREADDVVRIPSYLDIDAVLEAAAATGTAAVHRATASCRRTPPSRAPVRARA